MDVTLWAAGLGMLLGMRHALEPDHLAALGTLVTRQRSGWNAAWLGASWGVGHGAGLLGAGVVLGTLRQAMPPRVGSALEFAVAVMLCVLGVSAIRRARVRGDNGGAAALVHAHGGVTHAHPVPGDHVHVKRWTLLRRPLLVGLLHGLAGSGGLVALVVAQLPSLAQQLLYVGAFGLGGVAGMAAMTGAAGWGMQRVAMSGRAWGTVQAASGVLSVLIGAWWGTEALRALWA